jgi:hypothetical protein
MKKLTESDVIRIMREEWDAKVLRLSEDVDAVLQGKIGGKNKILLSPQIKLRHIDSKLLYTLVSVSPEEVVLKAYEDNKMDGAPPEEKCFTVDKKTLEKEYVI